MDDSSLKLIDVSRVTPSDSPESLTIPLTFFDLLWFKLHPVERVIFYRVTDLTRPFFDSVIVPNLKSSLSLSLSRYFPLAGKIVWNEQNLSIVYTKNDAVSFTVAESNAAFSVLAGDEPFLTSELYPLVPELRVSDDYANVVSFQVTFFPNQGFCIGVSAHHGVLDGKTTTMFLKTWAHLCKEESSNASLPQDLIPSYDRTVIKGPEDIEDKILNVWYSVIKLFSGGKEPENPKSLKLLPMPGVSSDVVRYTLNLTKDDIQKLRERIKRESESSSSTKELRLSTFVVIYSYALTCIIRARGGDPNRPVAFAFAVDCRNLVNPSIPSNYFGNCVSGHLKSSLTAETFISDDGFFTAAKLVSDSVEDLDETVAWKIPELLASYMTVPQGAQILSVAGSTRFGVYGLDFGWGKPDKVLVVSIDQGEAISMAEGKNGNGSVEVGFSLKKNEMDVLIGLLHDELNK